MKPCAALARPAPDRVGDGFAEDELLAHLLHRALDGGADHGFAQALDGGAEGGGDAGLAVLSEHLARQHERPGGGVDEGGGGLAQVAAPFGGGDLVLDEVVHRRRVGDAEERFGEAHERDAFVGREAVFGEEDLHEAGAALFADGGDEGGAALWRRGPAWPRRGRGRR